MAVGAVATLVAAAMTTEASSAHWAGAGGDPSTLHARAWLGRVRIGAQLFGAAVLAWTLLAWRVAVWARPLRAPVALPATLGACALLALLATTQG